MSNDPNRTTPAGAEPNPYGSGWSAGSSSTQGGYGSTEQPPLQGSQPTEQWSAQPTEQWSAQPTEQWSAQPAPQPWGTQPGAQQWGVGAGYPAGAENTGQIPISPYGAAPGSGFPGQPPTPNPYGGYGQPQPDAMAAAGYYGYTAANQAAPRTRDDNPIKALVDFGFKEFATPGIVKFVYILTFLSCLGGWLFTVIAMFAAGNTGFQVTAVPGVLALLFGWVPWLIYFAMTRMALEFVLVTIRTNAKVNEIADRLAANQGPGSTH